jgi:hypothetical protein
VRTFGFLDVCRYGKAAAVNPVRLAVKICKGGIIGRLPAAGNFLMLQMSRLFCFSDGLKCCRRHPYD